MSERDPANELVAEQLRHTLDLLQADLDMLAADRSHDAELYNLRLARLEAQAADFEQRLRKLSDSATQFRLLASLGSGGGLLGILTLLRELL